MLGGRTAPQTLIHAGCLARRRDIDQADTVAISKMILTHPHLSRPSPAVWDPAIDAQRLSTYNLPAATNTSRMRSHLALVPSQHHYACHPALGLRLDPITRHDEAGR